MQHGGEKYSGVSGQDVKEQCKQQQIARRSLPILRVLCCCVLLLLAWKPTCGFSNLRAAEPAASSGTWVGSCQPTLRKAANHATFRP